ncbi:MAG: hypothetical protein JEZ11_24615 [Desulfobacterales bacterium]|nr:hypothetical protein [Desulfobacterales bacterium]
MAKQIIELTVAEKALLDNYDPAMKTVGLSAILSTLILTIMTIMSDLYNGIMTSAALAVGDTAVQDVDHGAFDFVINGQKYSKAASGATELALDALTATADSMYNGILFSIGVNGTVDFAEDTGVEDAGYATAALAMAAAKALTPAADHIAIGWAALGNGSGVVTLGTTALTDAITFEQAPTMFTTVSGNA